MDIANGAPSNLARRGSVDGPIVVEVDGHAPFGDGDYPPGIRIEFACEPTGHIECNGRRYLVVRPIGGTVELRVVR